MKGKHEKRVRREEKRGTRLAANHFHLFFHNHHHFPSSLHSSPHSTRSAEELQSFHAFLDSSLLPFRPFSFVRSSAPVGSISARPRPLGPSPTFPAALAATRKGLDTPFPRSFSLFLAIIHHDAVATGFGGENHSQN